jgi:hypothetical protein
MLENIEILFKEVGLKNTTGCLVQILKFKYAAWSTI